MRLPSGIKVRLKNISRLPPGKSVDDLDWHLETESWVAEHDGVVYAVVDLATGTRTRKEYGIAVQKEATFGMEG